MNIISFEATHLAMGDYDEQDFSNSDCGSTEDHIKNNKCPRKQGVIGDCHYELYVRFDVDLKIDTDDIVEKKLEPMLKEYLKNNPLDYRDFEWEEIGKDIDVKQTIPIDMIISHEKVYYF